MNTSNAVIINNKIEPLLSTTMDLGLKVNAKRIKYLLMNCHKKAGKAII
jgi:hypothetical protein